MSQTVAELVAEIAGRIRATRLVLEASSKQVAGALGVSATSFSRYETGKRQMELWRLARFVKLTDVSADWILHGWLDGLTPLMRHALTTQAPELVREWQFSERGAKPGRPTPRPSSATHEHDSLVAAIRRAEAEVERARFGRGDLNAAIAELRRARLALVDAR